MILYSDRAGERAAPEGRKVNFAGIWPSTCSTKAMLDQTSQSHLCSELVTVLYEDRHRNTRRIVANLEEISPDSAVLLTEERLEPSLPITFCSREHDLYGCVESSCADEVLGWFTTVRLDRSSRWNGRWFLPGHFLSLCTVGPVDQPKPTRGAATKAFTRERR